MNRLLSIAAVILAVAVLIVSLALAYIVLFPSPAATDVTPTVAVTSLPPTAPPTLQPATTVSPVVNLVTPTPSLVPPTPVPASHITAYQDASEQMADSVIEFFVAIENFGKGTTTRTETMKALLNCRDDLGQAVGEIEIHGEHLPESPLWTSLHASHLSLDETITDLGDTLLGYTEVEYDEVTLRLTLHDVRSEMTNISELWVLLADECEDVSPSVSDNWENL